MPPPEVCACTPSIQERCRRGRRVRARRLGQKQSEIINRGCERQTCHTANAAADRASISIAFSLWCPYIARMTRISFASIAILLSLLPALALAAPAHKRAAPKWHGYGFLP